MKLLSAPRQPFVGLALAAAFGILLADYFPLPLTVLPKGVSALAFCALLLLVRPNILATYALVGASFFLLHTLRTTDTVGQRLAAQLGERPRVVTVTGSVASEPKVSPGGFSTFLFKLKSIEFEEKTQETSATWFVRWRGKPSFGDELRLFGNAEPVPPPRNPGEFDMRSYLARSDVRRNLFVRYEENGVVLKRSAGDPVLQAAQKSRLWLESVLCRGLEDAPEVRSFISGVTLGLERKTPEDIEEPFQKTGTLHLFAVSGLNVAIFAQLLAILAAMARLSKRWATVLIIPALFFYAAITGLHVSSMRAAVMGAALLGGFFFERKVFLVNSLGAAAFVLFCWNTNELFSPGFQLSFVVVAVIVLAADPLFHIFGRWSAPDSFLPQTLLRGPRYWVHRCFQWIWRGASVSLAAWIGSVGLILWYFHLVTPISLLANLLVVPLAFFVLAIGLLSILSAPVFPWLSVVFNNANWSLANLVLWIVQVFAQTPGGHFYVAHPHLPERFIARITVLDAGRGAAVHLRTGHANWLFDCGSERSYTIGLREYLHWAGINRVHGLLLSHGDSAHIGGGNPLVADLKPARVIDNPLPDRSRIHQRLRLLLGENGLERLFLGDRFQLSPQVTAEILYPPEVLPVTKTDDQTYVIRLTVGSSGSILFLSDAGEETERRLLVSGKDLRSDILIKGQHYSGRSGSEEFLDAVRPKLIVATSRDFPEHERITEEWAGRVQSRGIKLFRHDTTGAVILKFTAKGWEAQSYLTGEVFRSDNR